MPQHSILALKTIFSNVLADLAFMFTDDEDTAPSPGAQWLETTIRYDGPTRGMLRLQCTRDFSILLTSNLLGTSPEDDNAESKANDAVMEFMNILCGQFMTATHGTEEVFDLSIPQIRDLSALPAPADDADPDISTLSVSGHCVRLAHIPE